MGRLGIKLVTLLLFMGLPGLLTGQGDIFNNLIPEQIATGFQFTEGPAWHTDGYLLFSDIQGNTIYRWSEKEGVDTFVSPSGNTNGIYAMRNDKFVIGRHGTRDVALMDTGGNFTTLVSSFNEKSLNSPNDVTESYLGSIYFTDPPYGIKPAEEELGFYGVYCLPFDGTGIKLLDNQLVKPNGIVFSPDGRVLYVCDSYTNQIIAYSLRNEWEVKERWVFATLNADGGVDGITTDHYGNVYVAFGDGGIEIFTPEGTKAGQIDLPERVRNLCFGGKFRNILFITAGKSLYRLKIAFSGDFIAPGLLGVPTDNSVVFNALSGLELEAYIEYGPMLGDYQSQTIPETCQANDPIEIVINGLETNTQYYYRLKYKESGSPVFSSGTEGSFHTRRGAGESFSFAVEADPHLDEGSNYATFRNMLRNAATSGPDFLIDLGDNFMNDKLPVINYNHIEQRNLLYRSFWDEVCHSIPLFLVIGNHEGEYGWATGNSADNMPNMATEIRKKYYPNPSPGDFYTGSEMEYPFVGQRENYYSWSWGDALFIVLDPYINTVNKPGKSGDRWDFTLGREQYDWFRETLESSNMKFKFVFAHQLVGGGDEGRGGAEFADYFEMGGKNEDGSWGFDLMRPGWGKPLHQLMVENGVQIYFHGHDHFYACQEKDGIIYQLMPQPSHPNYTKVNFAEEYGYVSGEILPNSGHLHITIEGEKARVDYVSAFHEDDPVKNQINGSIRHSYNVFASGFTGGIDQISDTREPINVWHTAGGPVWIHTDQSLDYQIRLYSMTGQLLHIGFPDKSRSSFRLKLPPDIQNGIYLLNVCTSSFSETIRVVL